MAACINFSLYLIVFVSAAILIFRCRRLSPSCRRFVVARLTEKQKTQLVETLKLISKYLKSPLRQNEEKMCASIQKRTSEKEIITLLQVVHKVEVSGKDERLMMFKPTVQKIFSKESQHAELYNLVKESPSLSSKTKTELLEAMEPTGCLAKAKSTLEKKMYPKVSLALSMVKEVLGALLGLFLTPLQETKDVLTILSIKTFHQDVIQGRIDLIDNMPLLDFITILVLIYGCIFFLRLLNSVASAAASTEEETPSCRIDIFKFRLNPHWVPFLTEILIGLQTIKNILKSYKLKLAMIEAEEQLEASEEQTSPWKKVIDIAQDLEEADIEQEALRERRKKIKIVSCLGDILQGSTLMVLLLRTDLRVRSVLKLASLSSRLGVDPRNGGTSGKFSLCTQV